FTRADLERQEIVSKARLRRGTQNKENHQRTVEQRQSRKTLRRTAEVGEKRNKRARPDQVDSHDKRHGHAQKNAEQRQPKVLEADGLVMGTEQIAREEAATWRFSVIFTAVVVDHGRCEQAFCRS